MRRALLTTGFLLAAPLAWAQQSANSYLPEPDVATARSRSAQELTDLQTAAGIGSANPDGNGWWGIINLPAAGACPGGVYLVIEGAVRDNGQDFTATPTVLPVQAAQVTTGPSHIAQAQDANSSPLPPLTGPMQIYVQATGTTSTAQLGAGQGTTTNRGSINSGGQVNPPANPYATGLTADEQATLIPYATLQSEGCLP